MPKIDVYDIEGKKVKTIELKEEVFGIENEGRRRYNGSRILTSVDKKSPASKAVG